MAVSAFCRALRVTSAGPGTELPNDAGGSPGGRAAVKNPRHAMWVHFLCVCVCFFFGGGGRSFGCLTRGSPISRHTYVGIRGNTPLTWR